ncbi:hypothetical protein QTP70_024396 [Hemibagrus guttatus]|uniref:SPRY-associated domain-containing protein n=1 Tax=Hemibagrus guttatus TaxID=175788 RepID=A0AAE0Q901_9TELE|nr:hypothetical protein QTP70_024396 [Hemibagrus guttatus]
MSKLLATKVSTPLSENVQIGPRVSIFCVATIIFQHCRNPLGHGVHQSFTGCQWNPLPLLHDDITELADVIDLALLHLPFEDAPQMLNTCQCITFTLSFFSKAVVALESELKEKQMKFLQRIQETQKKVQELQQAVDTIKEKAELSRAEQLFEQEIADLQRRFTELEQLSQTSDHDHFLQEDQSGVYSCPQCRDTFTPKPVLRRNNMLVEVVEKLKNTEVQAASPAHCYAGPGDVECDFCTGRKHKAIKSCLSELKEEQRKSQQRIQEKQKKVQELKQAANTIKLSAQTAVEDSERIFTELISSMEKKRSEVTELIRAQEKTELSRAERLLEQLEQEIADLQRRLTELEQLSHTHDHIHFLQTFQFLCAASGCEDSPSITVNQYPSFYGVRKSLSDMKKRLEEFCEEDFIKIPEQDFCALTLDPNTGHRSLILSEKNRVVTRNQKFQRISNHPERIDSYAQVLSKESLCGRCYGEVEWKSEDKVFVSVSYKEINRKGWGNDCMFGHNDQSWSLMCSSSTLSFWHNNSEAVLDVPSSSRIMSNTNMRCEVMKKCFCLLKVFLSL